MGRMMMSSAYPTLLLGKGCALMYSFAICIIAVRICKLFFTTSRKISIDTFSRNVGLISLKKASSYPCSYCVP